MKMISSRLIIVGLLFFVCLFMVSCGDDPFSPENIESGNGVLDVTESNPMPVYHFQTSLGSFTGFTLYMNNTTPVITAASGLAQASGAAAPDPAIYPKGIYPITNELDPAIGEQYYMFIDDGDDRYFARFKITGKEIQATSTQLRFSWDFNTTSNDRNF